MNTVICSNHLCGKEYNVQFDKCPFCGTDNPMDEEKRKALIEKEKAENISVEDESTSQFHWLIVGLIWISIIFFGVRGVISSFTNMIFSPTIGIITLVLSLVGMVSLFFILQAKKWALFLWIAYRLAGGVVNGLINTKFDFATNTIIALVNIGLMLLILQIKKNGVSAWSLIFRKKVSKTDNKENVDEEVTSKVSQDTTSEQNEEWIRAEQGEDRTENFTEILSQDIADTLYDEQINYTIPEDKKSEQQVISTTPSTEEKPEDKIIDTPGAKLNTTGSRDDTPEKKKSLLKSLWWFFLIVIVAMLAVVWIVVFISHRDSGSEIEEYVYIDNSSILHSKRDCKNIAVYRGAKPIKILSKDKLLIGDWDYVCSSCIDDSEFDKLSAISTVNGNINSLYVFLQDEGYDFMGDINAFREKMKSGEKIESLYNFLREEGYILPSLDEYLRDLDINSKHPVQREPQLKKYNLRELYDNLVKDGYNDIGTYQEFYDWCNTEGPQGVKNRKKLYKRLVDDNYDMPEYNTYIRDLFNIKFWGE